MKSSHLSAILFFFLLCPFYIEAQVITTIAGTGVSGFAGDGGPATAAKLGKPKSLVIDRYGNLIIADFLNNRIRKIDPAGIITTIAGSSTPGYAGDGGPATSAQLWYPTGLALDTSGNIYFTELGNHVVRKVSASGIITTIAGNGFGAGTWGGYSGDGGSATLAMLNGPNSVAVDRSGNVFFSDNYNCRIRKVDAAGIITTVVGTGIPGFSGDGGPASTAKIDTQSDIAFDGFGNLYVSDGGNSRIRKVDTAGTITTISGGGTSLCFVDGPATAAYHIAASSFSIDAAGNIYFTESMNHVHMINTAGYLKKIAGTGLPGTTGDGGPATAASLSTPHGIAVDSNDYIFVAESEGNVIRRIGPVPALGVAIEPKDHFSLSPNPNNGTFVLNGLLNNTAGDKSIAVEITSLTGQSIYKTHLRSKNGILHSDIKLNSDLPTGAYLVEIHSDGGRTILQFVVER